MTLESGSSRGTAAAEAVEDRCAAYPGAVETFVEADRDPDRGHRPGCDVERVENDQVGAVLSPSTDNRDQPTVPLRRVG